MVMVKARIVDPTHLELLNPIMARKGSTVLVSVTEPPDRHGERQEWLAASSESLCSAYNDSEPEYSASMVKERNPDYGT